jgi:hypothetical protein
MGRGDRGVECVCWRHCMLVLVNVRGVQACSLVCVFWFFLFEMSILSSVCLLICLSSVCLFACLSTLLSFFLYIFLSICLGFYLFVCMPFSLSLCRSFAPNTHLRERSLAHAYITSRRAYVSTGCYAPWPVIPVYTVSGLPMLPWQPRRVD